MCSVCNDPRLRVTQLTRTVAGKQPAPRFANAGKDLEHGTVPDMDSGTEDRMAVLSAVRNRNLEALGI